MNEQDNIQKVEFFFLILIPKSIPLYTIFIACISSCAVLATFVTAQGPFEKKKKAKQVTYQWQYTMAVVQRAKSVFHPAMLCFKTVHQK